MIAKISQETLAEMIGTTRSRVSFFMNKFRKLGFIDYNGSIEVHSSLLNVVLHDQPQIEGVKHVSAILRPAIAAAPQFWASRTLGLHEFIGPCLLKRRRTTCLITNTLDCDQSVRRRRQAAALYNDHQDQFHRGLL